MPIPDGSIAAAFGTAHKTALATRRIRTPVFAQHGMSTAVALNLPPLALQTDDVTK